jgi:hypothetical protein
VAYVDQSKKAKIQAELKKAIPADWKWSLAVRHHSTIVLTIRSAPVDLVAAYVANEDRMSSEVRASILRKQACNVNAYYWREYFTGELAETFSRIFAALNIDNHDRSDSQSDYFDVGHYVDVSIGRWDKAFEVTK